MRNEILSGNLPLPSADLFALHYPNVHEVVQSMWHSLWLHYCANKGSTSSIYWMEQAGVENAEEFLKALDSLSNWVDISTSMNFSTIALKESKLLEFVDDEELTQVRFNKRFEKYLPLANTSAQEGMATVYVNGRKTDRKLVRTGMEIGAKSKFSFDQQMLTKYLDEVKAEVGKGMAETLAKYPELASDEANYGDITEAIVDYLADNKVVCNMGINNVDSRGRAIKSHLSKVANPIGFKPFRALVTMPARHSRKATVVGQTAILLFIAELNGYKKGTVEGKIAFGMECWSNGTLPHDLYEMIWCERLYKDLYGFQIAQIEGNDYYWSTPIELDASASLLQYCGVLLGDKSLLEATNVVSKGDLNDPWGLIPTVSRNKSKKVLMRQLYGSNRTSSSILDSFGDEYTAEEITDLETGLNTGAYGVANALKKFIIGNATMSPVMYPKVWGERLEVPCNRHHTHGEKPQFYTMLDSKGDAKTLCHWKTVTTPDLKSFKRWTMTGLIHSLDGRVIDKVMQSLSWGIDIHDAVIINPEDALTVRQAYASAMNELHADREWILNDYFQSVGIKSNIKTVTEWKSLMSMVTPLDEPFSCSPWAMK